MRRAARVSAALAAFAGLIGPPCFAAPAAAAPDAAAVRGRVRAYRSAHEVEIVRELAGLLGVPNVASDGPNIEKSAAAVAGGV